MLIKVSEDGAYVQVCMSLSVCLLLFSSLVFSLLLFSSVLLVFF